MTSAMADLLTDLLETLKVRTPIGYERCVARKWSVVCSRKLSGDSIYLEVQHAAEGPPLHLEIRVTAMATWPRRERQPPLIGPDGRACLDRIHPATR
jgi:hypothetical protein